MSHTENIVSICEKLNFIGIASLLENYGYDEPDDVVELLRGLGAEVRAWQQYKRENKPPPRKREVPRGFAGKFFEEGDLDR